MFSCENGDPISVNPNSTEKWEYGDTKAYQISSSQQYDMTEEITGYKFTFPHGGTGELTVKLITESPDLTVIPVQKFSVSYSSDDTLYITIPHNKDDYDFLCTYGEIKGASLTGISTDKRLWHSISNIIKSDSAITYIIPPFIKQGVNKKIDRTQIIPQQNFAFIRIQPNSTRAEVIDLVKQTVRQDVDYIGTFLENDARLTYNNRFKLLNLTWSLASDAQGSWFAFRNGWFGFYGNFGFTFDPAMNPRVIHHEAGHLINYLLYGVVNYEALWARFGDLAHSAFSPLANGREQGLQEDIAYIIESHIANEISFDADLTCQNPTMWNKFTYQQKESKYYYIASPPSFDFPSFEGFAAALINQLTANNTQMYTFDCINATASDISKFRIPSPTLEVSTSDIYSNILLKYPQTINDLMKYTTEYLSEQSPILLSKFLVRAEALGWSYNAKAKIVDSKGMPVAKAEVLPVMQTGTSTRDYYTVTSYKTDAEGNCTLPRLYPGESILRVFYNFESGKHKDSTDFPCFVDWTKPTNKQIDLGELVIGSPLKSSIEMVLIPAGSFQMGEGSSDVVHKVNITKPFYIGKYEISNKEYSEIIPGYEFSDFNPVEYVNWYEAVTFCNELSKAEGLEQCYTISGTNVTCNFSKKGYRLPTEAEWEYACRGKGTLNGLAENRLLPYAWNNMNSGGYSHPVGQKQATDYGLFDMLGNAREWCWDWYGDFTNAEVSDPKGPASGNGKVWKGGSYEDPWSYCTFYYRNYFPPSQANFPFGIRVVRTQ
jgi:hypothetical protein